MAEIKNKVRNALDEARMLVLAAQVVVGFQFRSTFEPGFETLSLVGQLAKMLALALMLVTIGLLIAPSSYHRIVEGGEDTDDIHRYTSKVMMWALLPFAFALGLDLFVATLKTLGWKLSAAAGFLTTALAGFFWYALGFHRRRERRGEIEREQKESEMKESEEEKSGEGGGTDISDKIKHVLTEARVVLPGAQALLGFQFIAVLTDAFEKLPAGSKYVHLGSLGFIALTVVLLMTPAAYHRIVERGEETEHFHRFASKLVVAALVPLALGLSGEVYVVVRKVTDSLLVAVVAALITLAVFWELWFGITLYRRTQRQYAK